MASSVMKTFHRMNSGKRQIHRLDHTLRCYRKCTSLSFSKLYKPAPTDCHQSVSDSKAKLLEARTQKTRFAQIEQFIDLERRVLFLLRHMCPFHAPRQFLSHRGPHKFIRSINICDQFARSFSVHRQHKCSDRQGGGKKDESQQSGSIDSQGISEQDKSILEKDLDLKSIIEDIKRDFANEDKVPKPSQKKDHDSNSGKDASVNTEATDHFEYDYSVAEDIEEYDYIDESEIGQHQVQAEKDIPISLERGESGVFELEELVRLLDHLGAQDIVTFPVPLSASFCDHMVVVSAKSRRHLQAINEELLWVHKRKKSLDDPHLLVEGINKSDWCAMDMGNIVLHVFYGNMREYYDIESLWTLGPENDPKCQEADQDPYALSAEDLFWLETGKSREDAASDIGSQHPDKASTEMQPTTGPDVIKPQLSSSSPRLVSDSDAGWGSPRSPQQK